jgi:hypothetical protein
MAAREKVGEPEFVAFVGIDWADQKHVWCLQPANSTKREGGELEHKPEVVEAWVSELCQRFGHGAIAVAVEQVKGALVYMLGKYECLHLYPVPSTMSASMRQALYPSGAKDDPRDADLLLDLLLQHRDKLRRLTPESQDSSAGNAVHACATCNNQKSDTQPQGTKWELRRMKKPDVQ